MELHLLEDLSTQFLNEAHVLILIDDGTVDDVLGAVGVMEGAEGLPYALGEGIR